MNLVQRVTNILTQPRPEWTRIDAEPATTQGLFTSYAMILALLPAVAGLLGGLLFAGMLGPLGGAISLGYLLVTAVVGYFVGLGILYAMGMIANALAPSFRGTTVGGSAAAPVVTGGGGNAVAGMKLVVYAATPTWIAGAFGFIPVLNILIYIAGFAYAAYLLYLGSMAVMKVPEGSAIAYTAVLIIIWIVLSIVVGLIVTAIIGAMMLGGAALGAGGALLR